jgi:hypothetical protein
MQERHTQMRLSLSFISMSLFIACSAAMAQDLGGFVGTVRDPSGGVIPDTGITVANPDKGFSRHVMSNGDGEFVIPRAPLGTYVITAEKIGFQKLVRTGVTLSAGDTLRVDLTLLIGSVSEQVTVSSEVAKLETESGALSDVVTGSQVTQLNLNARNFANLATLIPGAAALSTGFDPSSVGVLANATISFNGTPGNFNNWEIDSTNNVDQGSGSNSLMVYPSVDSIAEFRISTSNYSAEYGKSGGANIEVVTKSGTKDFHGTLFEFVRNDKFDANDWFITGRSLQMAVQHPRRLSKETISDSLLADPSSSLITTMSIATRHSFLFRKNGARIGRALLSIKKFRQRGCVKAISASAMPRRPTSIPWWPPGVLCRSILTRVAYSRTILCRSAAQPAHS